MILMLLCITAFQLIWFGQPKVTRKLGPMMAPVPQWTVAFNLLALTVSWQLKGSTAADPTQCPYFPTGKPDAKVYAPHGPWGNSWEVLRVKNYPQRVVEWAGLAGENILNMGEIGRAETATTALRWELAAPSSQKITVLLFVSFCIILYQHSVTDCPSLQLQQFLTGLDSCARCSMAIEVLGGFAAAKWYTQPPPKPKPVKLPDSTPKVIKDGVVQMAVDQDSIKL